MGDERTTRRRPRNTARYQPKLLVTLLLLLPLGGANSANDAKGKSDTVVDASSGLPRHGSRSRHTRHRDDPSAARRDGDLLVDNGSFSSMRCFEGGGSKCPNAAGAVLPNTKQSAAASVDSREAVISDVNPQAMVDTSNKLASASTASSPGPPPPPPPQVQIVHSEISAVLVLTLKDAHIATLLMTTLRACGAMEVFRDFFVVVPGDELAQIEAILRTNNNGNGNLYFSAHRSKSK